jgi:hypothetical protein
MFANKKVAIIILQIVFICNIIGNLWAIDTDSYDYIDRLLSMSQAHPPEIFDDAVIFTAPASYKKVGIAFAHESFAKIYWFKKLLVPIADTGIFDPASKVPVVTHKESGVLFYTYEIPKNLDTLEYRLVINGLWTVDPQNPNQRYDSASGLRRSTLSLPTRSRIPTNYDGPAGTVLFNYEAAPAQSIYVAGDFNAWDPFMYELKEARPGKYSLTLPRPAGTYHYVFFHKGERIPDPKNINKIYYANGSIASEVIVK